MFFKISECKLNFPLESSASNEQRLFNNTSGCISIIAVALSWCKCYYTSFSSFSLNDLLAFFFLICFSLEFRFPSLLLYFILPICLLLKNTKKKKKSAYFNPSKAHDRHSFLYFWSFGFGLADRLFYAALLHWLKNYDHTVVNTLSNEA